MATVSRGSVHWTKNRRRPRAVEGGRRENSDEDANAAPMMMMMMMEEEEEMVDCATGGFINGDFRSGKVLDLHLESKCWVTACCANTGSTSSMLAVGTATALQFYDIDHNLFTLVHQVPVDSQISALKWIQPPPPPPVYHNSPPTRAASRRSSLPNKTHPASDDDTDPNATSSEHSGIIPNNNNNHNHHNEYKLLAVARLDGHLCLYNVDRNILETQGPTLLYWSATMRQQIRCLDAGYISIGDASGLSDTLLLVAGDKQGTLTVTRFVVNDHDVDPSPRLVREEAFHSSTRQAILGVALTRQWLVTTDRSGCVEVHDLVRHPHHWWGDANNKNSNNNNNNRNNKKGKNKSANKGNNRDLLSEPIYSTQRSGAVHCATFAPTSMDDNATPNSDCPLLAFGGYDKTVVLVDTKEWLVVREMSLQGTVRTQERIFHYYHAWIFGMSSSRQYL